MDRGKEIQMVHQLPAVGGRLRLVQVVASDMLCTNVQFIQLGDLLPYQLYTQRRLYCEALVCFGASRWSKSNRRACV